MCTRECCVGVGVCVMCPCFVCFTCISNCINVNLWYLVVHYRYHDVDSYKCLQHMFYCRLMHAVGWILFNIVLLCDIYFYKRVLVVIISSRSFYEMQLYSKSILCNQYINLCTHKCHVCDCLVMFANTNICTPFMLFCSLLVFFLPICFSSALSIVFASMASFLKCF